MSICTYVYICVCMYVHMYACVDMCIYCMCVHVCMFECVHRSENWKEGHEATGRDPKRLERE